MQRWLLSAKARVFILVNCNDVSPMDLHGKSPGIQRGAWRRTACSSVEARQATFSALVGSAYPGIALLQS